MVLRDVVAPVHEVVGHNVPEVEGGVDEGDAGGREGQHVAREAGHGGGNEFVWAEGCAEGREEEGVGGDLPGFLGVRDLFVVFAIAAVVDDQRKLLILYRYCCGLLQGTNVLLRSCD